MYNIAKVAKGEILLYFNDVFDALSKVYTLDDHVASQSFTNLRLKLAADTELSVKNGAELLDRLVKDIVSESAANYVSILNAPEDNIEDSESAMQASIELPTAFSLNRFMPLLQERINVLNPYTRTFLVSWITLLDSIPDLELVSYLPDFLAGLFKFLDDENQDVHTQTQAALDKFLAEIKKIARVKRGLAESRKSGGEDGLRQSVSSFKSDKSDGTAAEQDPAQKDVDQSQEDGDTISQTDSEEELEEKSGDLDGSWVPGQDVHVDHPKILSILVSFLSTPSGKHSSQYLDQWYG
jgi:vacuole morphology and inheritance protein 14